MKKVLLYVLVIAIVVSSFVCLSACNKDKADDEFKVGVIHIGNPAFPGYTQAHDNGIVEMQQALGLKDSQIVRKLEVSDTDAAEIRTAIEDCIAQGCNIIYGTSFGYGETMAVMAEEYPNVIFSHGTGAPNDFDNYNVYFGRIYQARYLAGIAAGMKTQTKHLGYVAAFGTDIAETCSGINAFALGAQSVDPSIIVSVQVLNEWYNPANEKAAAEALIGAGCDVIAQHCDTANPQVACEEAGSNVFGCGYNSNMDADAPNSHLTATVWDWGVYYTAATRAAMECFAGEELDLTAWKTFGDYYGRDDLQKGLVNISPLTANCAEGTQERIDLVRNAIINDGWDVFSGVVLSYEEADGVVTLVKSDEALLDNQNNEIVAAGGASVSDFVIQVDMDYYVKGVSATDFTVEE